MDDEAIKKAVLGAIDRSVSAGELADVVRQLARGPRPTLPDRDGIAVSPMTLRGVASSLVATRGRPAALESALRIQTGLFPPSITSVGMVADLHRPDGRGIPRPVSPRIVKS